MSFFLIPYHIYRSFFSVEKAQQSYHHMLRVLLERNPKYNEIEDFTLTF